MLRKNKNDGVAENSSPFDVKMKQFTAKFEEQFAEGVKLEKAIRGHLKRGKVNKYNPEIHHRRSIRLKGYDYSRAGAYFVTICIQDRTCLFGGINGGKMVLNDAGYMVQSIWNELPIHYPGVKIDQFIVMPNHIHGIIILSDVGAGAPACPNAEQSQGIERLEGRGNHGGIAPTMSLPDVVHRFKSFTNTKYIIGVKQHNWQRFPGKLWQRNYYEHIIRNEDELNRIREYIMNNPARWAEDENNPDNL